MGRRLKGNYERDNSLWIIGSVHLKGELESLERILVFMEYLIDNGRQSFVFQLPVLMADRIVIWIKLVNFPVAGFVDNIESLIQILSEYFLSSCFQQRS